MSRIRSFKATYGLLAALSSLAVAACGSSGSATTDTSKAQKQPVYTFQGETTHHIICKKTANAKTNCLGFWPPAAVGSRDSISKQCGIGDKLGAFRNDGVLQLTLNGRPLYYFTPDLASKNTSQATGDEIKTFGSIWHVVATG